MNLEHSSKNIATIFAGSSTVTLLTTGDVLLTGYFTRYNNETSTTRNTFLYNFKRNEYLSGAGMTGSRVGDAATLLRNGQVLVSGGNGGSYLAPPQSSAELYTP